MNRDAHNTDDRTDTGRLLPTRVVRGVQSFACRLAVVIACGSMGLAICGHATAAAAQQVYQVGVAKQDITPRYPIRLNGFGFRRTESEGVTQPIYAKALAIGADDERPLVLITLDSLGVREMNVEEVAERLHKRFGIERDRLAVTFSHSHTTPKVTGACDTIFSTPIPAEHQAHIDQYTAELIDAMEAVAAEALAARQPSTLSWGVGTVGFAKNRRPQGGPVDHSLPVLVVKSADSGAIRAIYATYACHCVTLSHNKISGDWAGYAQHAVESRHPGVIALTSIGCGSDANPESGVKGDNVAIAAEQGDQIAEGVDRVLAGELRPISGELQASLTHVDLPLQPPPSRDELEQLAEKSDPAGYNAKFQLEKLARGESLTTNINYPIQAWEFGDSLAMVFLGGEICCDYSIRLRQQLDADRLWLHGYSNDFCAYIPSERLLREGGYGGGVEVVYFALPNVFAPGLEEKIVTQACRLVPDAFHRKDASSADNGRSWSVDKSLASIHVKPGLVVEPVAAEPLVADPVAIDFAADGRLWVAEMPDYSRYPDEQFQQHGNVRLLTDRDGDGRYDEMSVYVDGLRFPTGVKAWRQGVIVCDAPDVIYCEDADGDGKADVRDVLLTGFETHNAQARVNSLRRGLDNWLYSACGLLGGNVRTGTGREIALGQRDFRFRPDAGVLEPVTGRTQQGRARNDWGDWFGCENGSLLDHYPLDDRYLARNSRLLPPPPEKATPDAEGTQLHPVGQLTLFKLSGPPGRPTSVCGLDFYRDDLLGEEYANNAFVAEPVNQLVHRLVLSRRGATFTAHAGASEEGQEFLASSDPWFRPVQVRTGPDGCLYVVDMHRAVIEHQKFIPEETLREVNLVGGRDEGRIYRVRPADAPLRPCVDLTKLDAIELAAALDSPNGQQRDQVQELLVDRRDAAAGAPLQKLATESPRPVVRLQALCALDGLEALDADLLNQALADEHPAVRRHAIRLSEQWLPTAAALADKVVQLADDKDPQVQMQAAYSLGELHEPRAAAALARIAVANPDDPYMLAAVWSSVGPDNAHEVLQAVLAVGKQRPVSDKVLEPALDLAIEFGRTTDFAAIASTLSAGQGGDVQAWQLDVAAKLLRSVQKKSADAQVVQASLTELIAQARQEVDGEPHDDAKLLASLRLLSAVAPRDKLTELLAPYLTAQRSPAIQQGAVDLLLRSVDGATLESLLAAWSGLAAPAREHAFAALVGRPANAKRLLDAVASQELSPLALDVSQQQRLLQHADATIRQQAASVLAASTNAVRREVVARYLADIDQPGQPAHGKQLFAKHCASCHLLEGVGHEVGPDLAALTSRTREALVESILDPNQAVDDRYRSFTALTADGLAFSGVLSAETAGSVTIVDQQGQPHVLLRTDLESLTMSGLSLMPEGLERELSAADVNDLAAYIASLGQPAAKATIGPGEHGRQVATTATAVADTPAIKAHGQLAFDSSRELAQLVQGLGEEQAAQYERIPLLWEIAIAAGKRNDKRELAEILSLTLPVEGRPLTDWQIVVIGGGLINGMSEAGVWPKQRFAELLVECNCSASDWNNVVQQALVKADDLSTRVGTRYDALRVLAAAEWKFVESATKYAVAEAAAEMQMGVVQSLVDFDDPQADEALVKSVAQVGGEARRAAVRGLLRTTVRTRLLGEAIASGRLAKEALTAEEHDALQAKLKTAEGVLR